MDRITMIQQKLEIKNHSYKVITNFHNFWCMCEHVTSSWVHKA
jgi:hypothetical protein